MDKIGMEKRNLNKVMRIALVVSLALNLAVFGVIAGVVLRDGPGGRAPMVRDLAFGPYTEALSPADRKALRRALFERAPEIRETRQLMREDTRALLELLRADPFDTAAFAARMQGQQERIEQQVRLGQALLQDFIVAMPSAERRAFADRLEAGLRHGAKDHGKGSGGAKATDDD